MRAGVSICIVALIYSLPTTLAQTRLFKCDGTHRSSVAIFRNVTIEDTLDYRFSCDNSYYYTINTMIFVNSSIQELPKKLFDNFNSLQNVSMAACGIQQIMRYSLERASSLRVLDLSRNKMNEVKNMAFVGASSLVWLNLTRNNISVIEVSAFQSLSAVQVLSLSRNQLQSLDSNLFINLPALRGIYLDNNKLQVLDADLFLKNTRLEVITVDNNQLSVVHDRAFAIGPTNVTVTLINLKNNNITSLNLQHVAAKKIILSYNRLQQLYISSKVESIIADNNNIQAIQSDNPNDMQLDQLNLRNNSITTLDMVGKLTSLSGLDLGYNRLGAVSISSFGMLKRLKVLSLERTAISNLQHGTFAQQENLEWLDLSYNNLDTLDMDILTSSTNLKTLFIDGNRLKFIKHDEMKKNFPQLASIGIIDNNWNCSYLTKLVRYCNEHSIELDKEHQAEIVQNQTNVKGIYCFDDKNPIRNWNTTVLHLYNESNRSAEDGGALEGLLKGVIEDVRRFNEDHSESSNRTAKLEGSVFDLTQQQIGMQRDLINVRESIADIRLSLLSNRTNNASAVSTSEIRQMIESINNLTLEKQELSAKKLQLDIYQQSLKVENALETAKSNSDKLVLLGKQIDEWITRITGTSGGTLYGQLSVERHAQQAPERDTGHSNALLVSVLVIVCLMMGVLIYVVYKGNRRSYNVERRQYNRDSSLTTIVDNEI
ncbi:insulin-like growth factor-binding protein complex acid labile subunit [Anopheles aquasalis]|uniref:insulin-like growth factor-binding protein complex acid labile subunit n=1 Tax=Anopheles aquasalis TaxID=42839 RepID=UPI00215A1DAB|nr:insulin-like growth factor-binding protein complex acid labile subunit [Anopheles aquasalis]